MQTSSSATPFHKHVLLWRDLIVLGLGMLGVVALNMLPPSWWGVLLLCAALIGGYASRSLTRQVTPLDIPLLGLAVLVLLAYWATPLPAVALPHVAQLLSGIAGSLFVSRWIMSTKRALLFVELLALVGLAIIILGTPMIDWPQQERMFLKIPFYDLIPQYGTNLVHKNTMASLLILVLPLLFSMIFSASQLSAIKAWLVRGGWILATLASAMVLFMTQSRGGLAATYIGLLLALWWLGIRKLAIVLLIVGILGASVILIQASAFDLQDPTLSPVSNPVTLAFRINVWKYAILLLRDFPWTGTGMNTYNDITAVMYGFLETSNPSTHNIYLQAATDMGLLGLVILVTNITMLLPMGNNVLCSTRGRTTSAAACGILAGITAFYLHGFIDTTAWNTRIAFFPWLMIGWIMAMYSPWEQGDTDLKISSLR